MQKHSPANLKKLRAFHLSSGAMGFLLPPNWPLVWPNILESSFDNILGGTLTIDPIKTDLMEYLW